MKDGEGVEVVTKEECPNYEINQQQCPCPYTDCHRHGICCVCVAYHLDKGNKSICMRETPRPEETWNLPIGQNPDCPNRTHNETFCGCGGTDCPRHGLCCDCMRFHWGNEKKPIVGCMRRSG